MESTKNFFVERFAKDQNLLLYGVNDDFIWGKSDEGLRLYSHEGKPFAKIIEHKRGIFREVPEISRPEIVEIITMIGNYARELFGEKFCKIHIGAIRRQQNGWIQIFFGVECAEVRVLGKYAQIQASKHFRFTHHLTESTPAEMAAALAKWGNDYPADCMDFAEGF